MKTRHRLTQSQGLALVAAAATSWGLIPVLVRNVPVPSVVLVFWRMAFAAAVVAPLYLLKPELRAEFTALPWRRRGALAAQGALLALNWVLFFTGLQLAPVAVAELLGYCGPVFVAFAGPLVTGERFDRRILLPLALSLGGIAVILDPSKIAVSGSRELLGAACAFASAITYATLILNAKRLLQGISTTVFMTAEWVVASVLLLPAAFFLPQPSGATQWVSVFVLGAALTAGTGFLFIGALRDVRTDRAAVLTYLEPASAVVFAALFLGEPITLFTVLGGALIVGAGIMVTRFAPEETPESMEAPV